VDGAIAAYKRAMALDPSAAEISAAWRRIASTGRSEAATAA